MPTSPMPRPSDRAILVSFSEARETQRKTTLLLIFVMLTLNLIADWTICLSIIVIPIAIIFIIASYRSTSVFQENALANASDYLGKAKLMIDSGDFVETYDMLNEADAWLGRYFTETITNAPGVTPGVVEPSLNPTVKVIVSPIFISIEKEVGTLRDLHNKEISHALKIREMAYTKEKQMEEERKQTERVATFKRQQEERKSLEKQERNRRRRAKRAMELEKERKISAFARKNFQTGFNQPTNAQKEKAWNETRGRCSRCEKYSKKIGLSFWWVIHPHLGVKVYCDSCAKIEGLYEEGDEADPGSRSISEDVKNQVWNRDKGKCVECGSNENLEFDHIIPHSKGGSNTKRNIQLLCEPCNRKKSDKIG